MPAKCGKEGDPRRIDGDRQASAGRTQSPREKGWKEGDLHVRSHPETSPGASERGPALTSSRHNLASGLDSQAQEDAALCQRLFLERSQLC